MLPDHLNSDSSTVPHLPEILQSNNHFTAFFCFRWGKVTVSQEILQDLLPGPVTLVFERTDQLNPGLNPTTRLVGIRIPDHYFVRQLSLRCEEPLALTSANISTVGQSSLKIEVS